MAIKTNDYNCVDTSQVMHIIALTKIKSCLKDVIQEKL